VRLAIDVLLADGYLAEEPGPRGARSLRSVGPYREADEQAERLRERHADIAEARLDEEEAEEELPF
jgi:hypothetical protein